MKIADLRATTVAVPLEAPLRHANGCHWGRFVRTIVEIETDTGLIGLGEMGGGGESAVAGIRALKTYLVGRDPVLGVDAGIECGLAWARGKGATLTVTCRPQGV